METSPNGIHLVGRYHRALPDGLRRYLNARGIPDPVIDLHLLGWNGRRITVPVFDRDGNFAFFRLARDPEDPDPGPKVISPPGSSVELYGWERVRVKPCRIVICEGEFDRLVLEAQGFPAVTSTGGAGVFQPDWAEAFQDIPEVFLCFDRDDVGRRGAEIVGRLIPHARAVELPEEVGEGGDVTDFFVRLGRNREEFLALLEKATPVPPPEPAGRPPKPRDEGSSTENGEAARLKSLVRIEDLVGRYVPLKRSGLNLVGLCPFHEDRNPSLTVYPEDQHFHCFGCGAHGDAIGFLMRVENLTFPEALSVLREIAR